MKFFTLEQRKSTGVTSDSRRRLSEKEEHAQHRPEEYELAVSI